MTPEQFLEQLDSNSKVFDISVDYEFTEEQLILFAKLYHKKMCKLDKDKDGIALSPEIAGKILKARDAFVEGDYDNVWHWIYSIASPNYDKTDPWEELEKIAQEIN